jgi:hypothetical protein
MGGGRPIIWVELHSDIIETKYLIGTATKYKSKHHPPSGGLRL